MKKGIHQVQRPHQYKIKIFPLLLKLQNHYQTYYQTYEPQKYKNMNGVNEPAVVREAMAIELEIYLQVSKSFAINRFTFKAYLEENNHQTEVFLFDPQQDVPPLGQYKQLPRTFPIVMKFDTKQYLTIMVLERDTKRMVGKVDDLTIGEIFGSRREGVKKVLMNGDKQEGEIFVHFEKREEENKLIALQVQSENITSKRALMCFCPDSYYFTITKSLLGRTLEVYRSKPSKNPNYSFDPIHISTRKLYNNKPSQDFTFNFHNLSNNSLIGMASCTLAELEQTGSFILRNGNSQNGRVRVRHRMEERQYEFCQFYQSGMQMALAVAIDFTMSNLPISNIQSLHSFKEKTKSYYEIALKDVCEILLEFDYDKIVPVWGYGAIVNHNRINSGNQVLNCFPISGIAEKPDLIGLQGIIKGYRSCLPHLIFASPTLLAPVIRQSMNKCRQMKREGRQYMILMLLSDGDIDDFEETADLVIECSRLPISIVIVVISRDKRQKWPLMRKLDNNDLKLTSSTGKRAERDMVKFVQFMKCHEIPGQLSRQVLKELPRQVEEYHRLEQIIPADYRRWLGEERHGIGNVNGLPEATRRLLNHGEGVSLITRRRPNVEFNNRSTTEANEASNHFVLESDVEQFNPRVEFQNPPE